MASEYRGRIAPTPTGDLHLGHAATFLAAYHRARANGGTVILRIEDLDPVRCRPEFIQSAIDDLKWLGITWDEGPDIGGPHAPYTQSQRRPAYLDAWKKLRDAGHIYPCKKSRREIANQAAFAPHPDTEDPIFPTQWRQPTTEAAGFDSPDGVNWRFKVPDGETLVFLDGRLGPQSLSAGQDFGDFLIWNRDNVPAYELAVVVDDAAMGITEVVRGEDLLRSTARQLLIYRALGLAAPTFFHAPLICDANGQRLAKRHQSLSLKTLRNSAAR